MVVGACSMVGSVFYGNGEFYFFFLFVREHSFLTMEVTSTLLLVIATYLGFVIGRWALKRRRTLQLFKKYGIPGPEPSFLKGNMAQLRAGPTPNETITRWLKEYGNVFGYFVGGVPYVVINDLDMLKQVGRDFVCYFLILKVV